jgi:hypothetical protein
MRLSKIDPRIHTKKNRRHREHPARGSNFLLRSRRMRSNLSAKLPFSPSMKEIASSPTTLLATRAPHATACGARAGVTAEELH